MIWSKPVLVWSRLDIFDSGQNQRLQYFRGWAEIGQYEVPIDLSLPGFSTGMINEDFHITGI